MIILLTSTKQYQQTACKIAGGFSFAEDLDIQIYKTSLHYVSVTLKDKIKSMEIHKRSGLKIEMIAELISPVVRDWMNYFLFVILRLVYLLPHHLLEGSIRRSCGQSMQNFRNIFESAKFFPVSRNLMV